MDITEQIISTYNETKSIYATARHLGISIKSAKKILVSADIFVGKRTEQVKALAGQGKTSAEITNMLGISKSTVNENLPYSRGTYLIKSQTKNAENIRRCRKRKENKT